MTTGSGSKLNILRQSPHDLVPPPVAEAEENPERQWVPSRFNVRAATGDGRLVLWNTYWGSISLFKADEKGAIEMLLKRQGFAARDEGIVRYLARRGFLVPREADEYRRFQYDFGRQQYRNDILEMILLSSEDCNFRCKYCYEKFAHGTMKPEVREGIKKMVESRVESIRHLGIGWFGGEPLYGLEAIEDLAPFFLEKVEEHSLSYHSHMTTNGYLLTPDVAEKLLSWKILKYQITLDGPQEFHDRNRPTRTGQDTFWTIFGNLKALRERPEPYQVDIRINFDNDNRQEVVRLIDLVATELGSDQRFRLRFYPVGRWGGANDGNLSVCGIDEAEVFKLGMKKEARERGLPLADDIKKANRFGTQVCYAARPNHFLIGSDGKVMKCTVVLSDNDVNVVGQITADGGMELDSNKMALWTNPWFAADGQCQKCVLLPSCQGFGCPWVRVRGNERPCPPMRSNLKAELLGLAACEREGRSVRVPAMAAG